MKRVVIIAAIVIGAIGAIGTVVAVAGYGYLLFGIFTIPHQVDAERDYLLKETDHRAVAFACLDLLTKPEYQSLRKSGAAGDDPRWPAAIRTVKPLDVIVGTNQVVIMTTGGHIHLGLVFALSQTDSNKYDLVYREDEPGHDVHLYSVRR